MPPIQSLIEDLLLVGDFDAAAELVEALVRETEAGSETARRQTAIIAIDELVAGPMMRHVVSHLATIDDAQFERVKAMLVSMGSGAEVVRETAIWLASKGEKVGALQVLLYRPFSVADFLAAGARLVWVIDPERMEARVYRQDGSLAVLGEDDALDGEDVLPGFRCKLTQILA